MYSARVLVFVAVLVGLAHSFSWDIVVGVEKRLEFYYNGALAHAQVIPTASDIYSITYDPVQDRVLFVEYLAPKTSLASFDLATRKIQPLVTNTSIIASSVMSIAYDPVTQLLFWTEGYFRRIYSLSLKPVSSNKAVDANLLVTLEHSCWDIVVDSFGGYIYWATDHEIERAAFDGSKREVLLDGSVYARRSLAIDQPTQTLYWTEEITSNQHSIEKADLDGKNRKRLHFIEQDNGATNLVVTKDFIYWKSYDQQSILRLPKNQQRGGGPFFYSDSSRYLWNQRLTAANYTIKERTFRIQGCEALKNTSLDPDHKNSTECYGSTCHNYSYCFQGNCSVSAEGQPKCSCEAGYTGERCEVNACYKHCLHGGVCSLNVEEEPFCQCTAEYEGERCDVTTSLTGVHAEDATQEILRDLRRKAKLIKEELKRALQFLSDKIDEFEVKI